MGDDDLSRLLPKPPPPRPARRDAAITAAMRRFDGLADVATPEPAPPRIAERKWLWGPIPAFASIALAALIGIPLALDTSPGPPSRAGRDDPAAHHQASSSSQQPAEFAGTADEAARPAIEREPELGEATVTVPPSAGDRKPQAEAAQQRAQAPRLAAAPLASAAPPAAAPAPAAIRAPGLSTPTDVADANVRAPASGDSIVVTASRARRPAIASAAPAVSTEEPASTDGTDVVVTGKRISRPRAALRRGDWNMCTVDDPEQSLRGCKRLLNPAQKGSTGIAAARVADGLTLAWQEEWSRAIDAFDQAIALDPKLAIAYLNRGLAYQRSGDLARAAADLDRAVDHSPRAARGYYWRSVAKRMLGDHRGAAADAARSVDLDSRYRALLD